ncbi:MAG TPA: YigZ family protein [Ignavibacteriaceae bacterium]|nr:YigZ family protein [Ignavibacteriaceae bacterium]
MKELPEINVIENTYKIELKEKGSRFLSYAVPVENEETAFSKLEEFKKEFYDASHHCYAFKLLNNFKYSDAGEPSGTAGIRILNAIDHFHLVNILLVVVRYFGGTKLGVGGLGRAYYDSALQVLETAEIKKRFLYQKIIIKLDFQFAQKVYHLFNDNDKKILKVNYDNQAMFECIVKPEMINQVIKALRDLTNGSVEIINSEKIYC